MRTAVDHKRVSTVIIRAEAANLLNSVQLQMALRYSIALWELETRYVIFPISPQGRSDQEPTLDLLLDEEAKSACGGK